MLIDAAKVLIFPSLMAFAASSDLLTMTISNRVSLLLMAGFGGLALATGMTVNEIGFHLLAGGVVLAAGFFCFSRGWIGGGDAKLAAGAALWFGFAHLLDFMLFASVLGGGLTLLILSFRAYPLPPQLGRYAWIDRLHRKESGIPYGIALAAAAMLIYPYTVWMTAGA
ncbi:MAG: A24 family peptidase [Xanthobacteraceae bacterium]